MFRAVTLLLLITTVAVAEEKPAGKDASAAKPAKVTVSAKSWADLQKLVAKQKDRVVVVDLWSTWCTPCLRELPHLVQLADAHPKQVVGVSVCLDYNGAKGTTPESAKPGALKVLEKIAAKRLRNFVSADADEVVYNQLDLGSVPAVLVYRNGELVKRFDNDSGEYGDEGFTYEKHVTPFVTGLLER